MKNRTTKKLTAFITVIILMLSFATANAQSCNGGKIRVYKCGNKHCHSKCFNPDDIPSGWSTSMVVCMNCGGDYGKRLSTVNDIKGQSIEVHIIPNPFSTSTTIYFSLEQSQNCVLKIVDLSGRPVTTLADKFFEKGYHEVEWIPANVNTGVYFLLLQSAENLKTEKLIVTK